MFEECLPLQNLVCIMPAALNDLLEVFFLNFIQGLSVTIQYFLLKTHSSASLLVGSRLKLLFSINREASFSPSIIAQCKTISVYFANFVSALLSSFCK